ncbi:MAG: caspase family protein [Myxococcota bacterium]|nr:caspase family protein [Myxococcota bacterium]
MVQTLPEKTLQPAPPPEAAADHLQDALSDPLLTRGGPTETTRDEIEAGPGPGDEREIVELEDGTPYIEYPDPTQTVRGTTKHSVDLNAWADGSALVANSSSDEGLTHDSYSLYDAYAGYSEEHPEWSRETRLTMASREDINVGGDVVSAKRRDGGDAPRSGRKFACVIGNSDYKELNKLPEPVKDAKAMQGRWESEGFSVVSFLDVDSSEMTKALEDIPKYAKRGDDIRVYYAGHGVKDYGLAGVNAHSAKVGDLEFMDGFTQYGVIGNLASDAVTNGWHLTAIVDACQSAGVATAVLDALEPSTASSRSLDYDLELSEIKEKGLVSEGGRKGGVTLNELLFKSFVNPHGWDSKYGKGGAKKLLEERGG